MLTSELLHSTIEFERRRDAEAARMRHLAKLAARCCTTASRGLRTRLLAALRPVLARGERGAQR